MSMRIGVDARELIGRPTGVGRYLAELIAAWAADPTGVARRHDWRLYAPGALGDEAHDLARRLDARVRHVPGRAGTRWEQLSLARAANGDQLDVLFAPAYTAPLAVRCPVVLTLHDVSFLAHPEWFRPRERLRRSWLTRRAAARARLVLTVSEFSRQEIARLLPLPPDRLRVILHGRPSPQTPPPRGPDAHRPLVLYVGSIFNRRRVPDLIEAFSRVARQVPLSRLAIVGENRTWPWQDVAEACRATGLGERIELHDYVDDARLGALYAEATCFVFLSEYEGFGLTPQEALAHGIPPVLLDTPVARETCGPAALYVRRGDIAGTAESIARLLTDGAARSAILEGAGAVLGRYSWERAGHLTLAAIEEAAS